MEIVNPLNMKDWDELIYNTGSSCFFHTNSWLRVLNETYNYSPLYFTTLNPNQKKFDILIPMMQINSWLTGKRGVSLPFSDRCPLILDNTINFFDVFENIIKYGKENNWKYVELRDDLYFENNILPSSSFYDHTIPLPSSPDQILKRFKKNNQRNIKKAAKEKIEIIKDNSTQGIINYYNLHLITRKRHGLPPQPRLFFQNIYKYIIEEQRGNLFFATFENNIIAGMVFFEFNKTVLYKYGASNKIYQNLRPNNLLMWEAIKYYIDKEFDEIYLGRTALDNDGLRRFKLSWNPIEKINHSYRYYFNSDGYKNSNFNIKYVNQILKMLPINILSKIGSSYYEHFG